MYDENREDPHAALEQAAAESKEEKEAKIAESQENRKPDYEDDAQNLGRAMGLTGSAAIAAPRPDAGDAPFASPRHTATGEWQTPNGGGGGAAPKAKKASASSETSSS
jgi:hypothetical protein